ncbi:hypothetical protein GJA_832 [Janthinobacterium agaricidamnosum NBRC 102515 = DSM 9628]|uniref:Uncharacterized protein n=1 Tax=Janthinobacterium agaricidamnosum NBRC 102515 = DSM 9628 TaxID=1349767 RepID=W0V2C4_9BURK|nr:hypothetical protein GJA_832 [Janthinobacterium agaricidamnosum NBRC 102515 = DSM 9628]
MGRHGSVHGTDYSVLAGAPAAGRFQLVADGWFAHRDRRVA